MEWKKKWRDRGGKKKEKGRRGERGKGKRGETVGF